MAPIVAIVVLAVNTVPWVAMTLVLAMLVAIGVVEHVTPVKSASGERHRETGHPA
jgi:hypothetical protein